MNPQQQLKDLNRPQSFRTAGIADSLSPVEPSLEIKIGKKLAARQDNGAVAEIFTMTLGAETIELLPFKNWTQLDTFKWRARCILPRIPAGLEISWDHLKVAGATVSSWDPEACAKLEKAFNAWLALEKKTVELTKAKAQAAREEAPALLSNEEWVQFKLDLSNVSQPRLQYLEGSQIVKGVALNIAGLNAMVEQGFMRKPGSLKVGALNNWVELDGEMFRFKEDPQGAQALERTLNDRYLAVRQADAPPDVIVSANPASPSGFDIQFPATPLGVVENRKRHLNAETVELLQDPERCHVLRTGITARFAPPDLIIKVKTANGGEQPLEPGPDSTLVVTREDGQNKSIPLSQPVSLLTLGVAELNAIFNHPAINRRARPSQIARLKVFP